MVGPKLWIRNFFGFSRKETNGFIILLLVMALLIFSEPVSRAWIASRTDDNSAAKNRIILDSLVAQWKTEQKLEPDKSIKTPNSNSQFFFDFDPNFISHEKLNRLGFTKNLASRIIHYREKGGKFQIKSDLLKIYGIDSTLYRKLYSYIQLPISLPHADKSIKPATSTPLAKEKFDLNLADTSQLKKIYGIGSVLSLRIVKYRNNLGGFIKPEQLIEIFGLDSSVVRRLIQSSFMDVKFAQKQINLNTASESELDIHPYITKPMAKAIVTYRFQHGKFNTVEEIRKLQLIDDKVAAKLLPYLKVQD